MSRITIVIPCYNEENRLDINKVDELLSFDPDYQILFVDDGSKDNTSQIIELQEKESQGRKHSLGLMSNSGKAEAVRLGLLRAVELNSEIVGFIDADFATPPSEVHRLIQILKQKQIQSVFGARVKLLGWDIDRVLLRHYMGRIFATFAANIVGLSIYDTQCGAKFFKSTDLLSECLSTAFHSPWAFDVELFGRLFRGTPQNSGLGVSDFFEVPLNQWHEIGGSKVKPQDALKMGLDLITIFLALRKWKSIK